ncbi:MAG TPA: glycosyltransferase family 4 protein [Candidatus Obscuribacterales bacterium]
MRICLISREFPPDTGWGGIATFTRHLALGLSEIGHEVEVVSLATAEAKTVEQEGIRIHRVEPFKISGDMGAMTKCVPYSRYVLRTTTALWKKFAELHMERPFDIVDTPELLAEGLVPAVTKALPLAIRLYTPHSKFMAERLHNVTPTFDHQFVAIMERIAMVYADAITSPSEDLADFVAADMSYPRERITIIRNPIDAQEFTPDGEKAFESGDKLTVLFVGRLEERKGIGYLIDAVPQVVKAVPNARFVIIGDDTNNARGQKSVRAELDASLRLNGCSAHVEFMGRVPLATLPNYYRAADVCIVPSVYDNSPYTCLEAMSCGRAVVGTAAGGTPEYLGDAGVLIPPKDAEAIAQALIKLLLDKDLRDRLGQAARKRAAEKFDRKEIARQTAQLYEAACTSFISKQPHRLYLKNPQDFLADAEQILYMMDKMIYDLLYAMSWRFRIWHWWTVARRRPLLFAARLGLKAAKLGCRIIGRNEARMPETVRRLEQAIEAKQGASSGQEAMIAR